MKKYLIFIIALFMTFSLISCKKENVVKVLIPAGGPTLSLVKMIHEDKTLNGINVEYEITSGPDMLTSAITSKSHQIVIAPSNLGANLYNKGATYLYAATISHGNLFLIGKTEVSINALENQTIAVFGKNSTPDIILKTILSEHQLLDKVTLEYYASVDDVKTQFLAGKYQYALVAEPALSVIVSKTTTHIVVDLQSEYQNLMNTPYPQSAIFIERDFYNNNTLFVKAFLEHAKSSVTFVNANYTLAANMYLEEKLTPTLPVEALISCIPNSNIVFEEAAIAKPKVISYFTLIEQVNINLIGGKLPDEDFYLTE